MMKPGRLGTLRRLEASKTQRLETNGTDRRGGERMKVLGAAVLSGALAFAAGCATVEKAAGPAGHGGGAERIAELDAAVASERDKAKMASLLFQRGHAYLEAAESVRDRRGERTPEGRPSTEFATLVLGALRDFEAVTTGYPASPEAPESLFHMGVVYDYPNLSSFGIAMRYYGQTIEKYPGTDSAAKAKVALGKLEARFLEVQEGRHGK
jgi:hypothetical protein